jgi:hypothetical protein
LCQDKIGVYLNQNLAFLVRIREDYGPILTKVSDQGGWILSRQEKRARKDLGRIIYEWNLYSIEDPTKWLARLRFVTNQQEWFVAMYGRAALDEVVYEAQRRAYRTRLGFDQEEGQALALIPSLADSNFLSTGRRDKPRWKKVCAYFGLSSRNLRRLGLDPVWVKGVWAKQQERGVLQVV